MKYLVGSPEAEQFIDLAMIDSGLKAMLGDQEKVDKAVGPEIVNAHIALREGAKKVVGLAQDPTRTDVARHHAAKKVATATVERLTKTKAAIEQRANQLRDEGAREADEALGPKSELAGLHSEIRTWLREQTKTPEGLGTIKKAMAESDDLAAVLWHSPSFLLGVSKSTHEKLRIDALEARRPITYAKIAASIDLMELAGSYDKAIGKVERAFYNPHTAEQATKRVEV